MKRFVSLTQTGEQTAIYCLSQHDWKLELASDAYFQNPEVYYRESMSKVTASADRKKIDQLFNKYRGIGFIFYELEHSTQMRIVKKI